MYRFFLGHTKDLGKMFNYCKHMIVCWLIILILMTDDLEWVHIPIQDETAPSLDQIQHFVALVDKAKNDNKVSMIKQIKLFSVLELMFILTLLCMDVLFICVIWSAFVLY